MEPLKYEAASPYVLPKQRLETLMAEVESEMQHTRVELLRKIVGRMSPSERQAITKLSAAIQFAEIWGETE